MYDLSTVIDVPRLAAVDPGTSFLISGPAMTGTDAIAMDVLAGGAARGEGAVAVTTQGSAETIIEAIQERSPGADPRHLAAIDCRRDGDGRAGAIGESYRYQVADPSDVTGMGVGITNSFDRLQGSGVDRIRFGLVTLSTMLTYADEETIFKFCHVLSSRIDAAGYLGAFTIDEGAHDAKTLQVLKQPFDAILEVREQDGGREARVRGFGSDPTDWVPLRG
ncbi:MAG: hypothetical protein ABEH64_12510 [Salinirussus sp.]